MHLPVIALAFLLGPVGTLAASKKVSTDASCGGKNGYTCLNSQWGDCCSSHGWCGSTSAYCGTGCDSAFGTCTKANSAPSPSSQPVSTDARCGPSFGGQTCQGSDFGDCCSLYSWCGSTSGYCAATNCQKGFGKCNAESSSSAPRPSTLVTSTRGSQSSSIASRSVGLSSSASSAPLPSVKSSSSKLSSSPSPVIQRLTSSVPLSSSTGVLQSPSASASLSSSVGSSSRSSGIQSFPSSIVQSSGSSAVPSLSSTVVPSVSSKTVPSSSSSKVATSSSVQATPVSSSSAIVSSSSIKAISSSISSKIATSSFVQASPVSSSSSVKATSSISSKVVSSSALSSAAASGSSIPIVSPTRTTQPSSSSIVPSSSNASPASLATCGVLGTINKNSVYRGGLSKTQSTCRQECLDYNTSGWKCKIYSMPTLYAGCTLLLSNPAQPTLSGAYIKSDTGDERYWDVTCEVSDVPFTYPSPIPAKGCDAPGIPGRTVGDVPSDYGYSKTVGDCHQECLNYGINGWKCRAYGFSASPPLCWLTLGKPAPALDVVKRESGSNTLWWDTSCAGAAPAWPSIPGTSPWKVSQCGMRGRVLPYEGLKFKYDILPKFSRSECKKACEKFNMSGDSCKVYGVSPTDQTCYLTYASKAPSYDDAFVPQTTGSLWWFQEGCSDPDTWFRQNGLLNG